MKKQIKILALMTLAYAFTQGLNYIGALRGDRANIGIMFTLMLILLMTLEEHS